MNTGMSISRQLNKATRKSSAVTNGRFNSTLIDESMGMCDVLLPR